MEIPAKSKSKEEVLEILRNYKKGDPDWSEGRIFGYVFHAEEDTVDLVENAFRMYMWDNALDPSVFKSLLRLETEIVAMCANHLGGDKEVVGNFTSGGTESVLLAVKTARDWARTHKPHIKTPEMILPITAHPCFNKGSCYFDVKVVTVPVNPQTLQLDVNAVKEAINENTILLVGNAPSFAFGVVDPIPELGQLALDNGILLHVDGCMGGFILPCLRKLGHKIPQFDFSTPGVTSMSMDLHKYAFAAKGASVVLYKNKELRLHQIFTHSGWTGYTIINPTIQSSKSAGPLAGAWAILNYLGQEGYLKIVDQLHKASQKFIEGIANIDGLYVMGKPDMCLIAVSSERFNIFELCETMKKRGWYLIPQPGMMGVPAAFHITMLPFNTDKVEQLLVDLKECTENLGEPKESEMIKQVKAMMANIDFNNLNEQDIQNFLGMVGLGSGQLPEDMTEVNMLMNELPTPLLDKVLTYFFNEWNRLQA